MLKTFSYFFLLTLFFTALASAEIYKQYDPIDLHTSVSQNGSVSGVSANITIRYPDNSIIVAGQPMTNVVGSTDWNYTFTNTSVTGVYSYVVCGYSQVENECFSYTFEVTPSGKNQTSILDNPIILVFGILGILFLGLGIYQGNSIFGFLGAVLFILGGVYTMIYGFNNEQNMYTQGIAMTIIGTGFIFMFLSAYEWLGWGSTGGDEDDD